MKSLQMHKTAAFSQADKEFRYFGFAQQFNI